MSKTALRFALMIAATFAITPAHAGPWNDDSLEIVENAWDFNADGVPGFGSMKPGDDVKALMPTLSIGEPATGKDAAADATQFAQRKSKIEQR